MKVVSEGPRGQRIASWPAATIFFIYINRGDSYTHIQEPGHSHKNVFYRKKSSCLSVSVMSKRVLHACLIKLKV